MLQLLKHLTSRNIHNAKAYFAKGRECLSLTSVVSWALSESAAELMHRRGPALKKYMKESFNYFSRTWTRTFNHKTGRTARTHLHKLQFIHYINCMHSPLYALLWTLAYTKHKRRSRDSTWCTWAMHVQHNCFLSSFTLLLCFQTQWQRICTCAQATLHVHIRLLAFHLLSHLMLTDEQCTGS